MGVYNSGISQAVKAVPVPHDFQVDIVEYDFVPPYIGLRFYESHWRHFSDKERLRCIEYLDKIKKIIESHGINVTIDPVYDVPGSQELG